MTYHTWEPSIERIKVTVFYSFSSNIQVLSAVLLLNVSRPRVITAYTERTDSGESLDHNNKAENTFKEIWLLDIHLYENLLHGILGFDTTYGNELNEDISEIPKGPSKIITNCDESLSTIAKDPNVKR
ncbi:hypothetical protein Smp_135000 [Schistosoma mansoni]|uniref:hypothetical protein n=1 Tax=Schistosoma mansoni TaxID=6183 RepID=UPI00022DCA35|nr:hypothetical protein Smp_135000 [Schistosoma mansoni]|eukprot:XP_018654069.1 hypothetical protein Smp_135000 [Schistosoma mansoni]